MRLAAAVLLALTLAACGGSSKSTTPTPTPTPTPLTAAQAKTVAAAGVLTTADLPGYTAEAQTEEPEDAAFEAALYTCLGIAKPSYLAEDLGRSFTKGELEVDSSASVVATADVAKADVAAYSSAKGPACLKTAVTKQFANSGLVVESTEATQEALTVEGADAVSAFRMSIDASSDGQPIQLRGYLVVAAVGQTEIALDVVGTPTSSLTLDETKALLEKAVDRAAAAAKTA